MCIIDGFEYFSEKSSKIFVSDIYDGTFGFYNYYTIDELIKKGKEDLSRD